MSERPVSEGEHSVCVYIQNTQLGNDFSIKRFVKGYDFPFHTSIHKVLVFVLSLCVQWLPFRVRIMLFIHVVARI